VVFQRAQDQARGLRPAARRHQLAQGVFFALQTALHAAAGTAFCEPPRRTEREPRSLCAGVQLPTRGGELPCRVRDAAGVLPGAAGARADLSRVGPHPADRKARRQQGDRLPRQPPLGGRGRKTLFPAELKRRDDAVLFVLVVLRPAAPPPAHAPLRLRGAPRRTRAGGGRVPGVDRQRRWLVRFPPRPCRAPCRARPTRALTLCATSKRSPRVAPPHVLQHPHVLGVYSRDTGRGNSGGGGSSLYKQLYTQPPRAAGSRPTRRSGVGRSRRRRGWARRV
jgi:hypothetical protein